jgi:hypothetical protein
MEIIIPDPKPRIVKEYDFTFSSGQFTSIPIDEAAGDIIEFSHPQLVKIHLAERASKVDGSKIPAETVTLFLSHVVLMQERTREVTQLTKEQQKEWNKTLQEMVSKAIH